MLSSFNVMGKDQAADRVASFIRTPGIAPSCIVAMKYGAGNTFSSCLLTMLNAMLAPESVGAWQQ